MVAREMPESDDAALPAFRIPGTLKRTLTPAEHATYIEEGYVVLRNFYSTVEINMYVHLYTNISFFVSALRDVPCACLHAQN